MWYDANMTVADLIEKLKALPQDLPVVQTEGESWGSPEPFVLEAGDGFDGHRFDHQVVIL